MMYRNARLTALCRGGTLWLALMGTSPAPAMAQAVPSAAVVLPADSLYRLSIALTDAQGRHFNWHDLAGRPTLATMFYGDCNTACPLVLKNLQQTIAALKLPAGRLAVTMISLDPLHDTPASLNNLAQSHHLDQAVFRLALAADDSHTPTLAAVMNIKYRLLAGGEISHTTRVLLLDANGHIIASNAALGIEPDPEFLKQIRSSVTP